MSFQDIKDIALILFTPTVIVAIILWIRFKKKDTASINLINAQAQEKRAQADVLITDGALRIVERLSKDLDEARDEIEKLMVIVAELKALHEKSKSEYTKEAEALHTKIKEAKNLIEVKRRHCVDIRSRITQLKELLILKQQGLQQDQLEIFITKLNELIALTTAKDELPKEPIPVIVIKNEDK